MSTLKTNSSKVLRFVITKLVPLAVFVVALFVIFHTLTLAINGPDRVIEGFNSSQITLYAHDQLVVEADQAVEADFSSLYAFTVSGEACGESDLIRSPRILVENDTDALYHRLSCTLQPGELYQLSYTEKLGINIESDGQIHLIASNSPDSKMLTARVNRESYLYTGVISLLVTLAVVYLWSTRRS